MPTFDIVSEINHHEMDNAINQTVQEISRRFDLKDTSAEISFKDDTIKIAADDEFQLDQVEKILHSRLIARKLEKNILDPQTIENTVSGSYRHYQLKEGISTEVGKNINQLLKGSKLKVQSSIQQDKVRVTGKKLDDLQSVIALLKEQDYGLPLQFNNFRD
ncbi:YajQ family cyclic di-GMP-binding protein [Gammaproteobacteria bacterium]|nr:YajQ family cyclic di-GMP-binding protein [Gammaproteobacteria bacterium]